MQDDPTPHNDRALEATYAVDRSGRIVLWSDGAQRILGFSREEALGRRCDELLHGHDGFGNRYCSPFCPIRATAEDGVSPEPFLVVLEGLSAEHPLTMRIGCVPEPGPDVRSFVHTIASDRESLAELVRSMRNAARLRPEAVPSLAKDNPLTKREHEIVKLLANGDAPKAVAARLGVSRATVRNHIQNVLRKLDVHGQVEAVSVAFRSGWL